MTGLVSSEWIVSLTRLSWSCFWLRWLLRLGAKKKPYSDTLTAERKCPGVIRRYDAETRQVVNQAPSRGFYNLGEKMDDVMMTGASVTEFYSPKQGRFFFAASDEQLELAPKELIELQFFFPEGVTVQFVGFVRAGAAVMSGIACTRCETSKPERVGLLNREPFQEFISLQFQNRNSFEKAWAPILLFKEVRP